MKEGDIVDLIDKSDKDWWLVRNLKGKEGYYPKNYLKKPDYCTNCRRLGHTADKCYRCTRCKKIGHDATTCTAIICERCGYLNHTAKDCRTPYCTFCRNFGHISSKCYKLNK